MRAKIKSAFLLAVVFTVLFTFFEDAFCDVWKRYYVVKKVNAKDPLLKERLVRGIRDASRYYGFPEAIFWAIAKVESGYRFNAVNVNKNKSVDYGVFQINSENLRRWGIPVEFAFDPYWASFLAGHVLKKCFEEYGNSWKTVDCYNKGKKAGEASHYVWKVYYALKSFAPYVLVSTSK